MSTSEIHSYTVEPLISGMRYLLPKRDLGDARKFGWVLTGLGGFITLFMCFWMAGPTIGGIGMLRDGEWFGLLLIGFGCLGLFGLVPGVGMLVGGIAVLNNATQCIVELRDGRLWSIEKFGPLRWRRKRCTEELTKLEIGPALRGAFDGADMDKLDTEQLEQITDGLSDKTLAIVALGGKKPFKVAPGYPKRMLVALANDIAERIAAGEPGKLIGSEGPTVEVIEVREDDPSLPNRKAQPLLPQPSQSDVGIERRPNGLTLTIPPAGLWKGSKGLFVFSIAWNGFCLVFTTFLLLAVFGVVDGEGDPPTLGLLFMIPFLAVGVATMIGAINMARRRAIIDVVGDTLLISRQSLFGTKQAEWPAHRIQSIKMGPSGTEINNVPVMEFQVRPKDGKKLGLLSQRGNEELRWIVSELNHALQIESKGQRD